MSNHFSAAMLKFPADDARLDRILPFDVTAARLRDEHLIADLTVVEIADGPITSCGLTRTRSTPRCCRSSGGR
jgi:hypothetical protein